jgi:hypothetical protein
MMWLSRITRLALLLVAFFSKVSASGEGCYHPDDHHCECKDLTQSICEHGSDNQSNGKDTGNVWTDQCKCDHTSDAKTEVKGNDTNETQHGAGDDEAEGTRGGNSGGGFTPATADQDASVARWVLQEAKWATLTTLTGSPLEPDSDKSINIDDSSFHLFANILPFAADQGTGRLFLYLLGEQHHHSATLTVSQASLNPSLFAIAGCGVDASSVVDAQDPRCAKLSVSGGVHPCSASNSVPVDCELVGLEALFQAHPTMKDWPIDHNFVVHELVPFDDGFWMLANFGGGSSISRELYESVKATPHSIEGGTTVYVPPSQDGSDGIPSDMPFWTHHAARARWVVHHSMWTTVSTINSRNEGEPIVSFGNVRSVTDLSGLTLPSSSGLPVFYVPDVDPTAVDMKAHQMAVALTFTEAAIAERLTDSGLTCAGQDAGIPTCGQVMIYGTAKILGAESSGYKVALSHFVKSHPLAPWLSQGGSHMGGHYYTIDPTRVAILDFFGGVVDVPVSEYLGVNFQGDSQSSWYSFGGNTLAAALFPIIVSLIVGCLCGCGCHKYALARKTSSDSLLYSKIGPVTNNTHTTYSDCEGAEGGNSLSLEEEDDVPTIS